MRKLKLNKSNSPRLENCKCGLSDHSYTSSFKCPLNEINRSKQVKNRNLFQQFDNVPTITAIPTNNLSDMPKLISSHDQSIFEVTDPTLSISKCICGASDHRSTRNKKCIFYKTNNNSTTPSTHRLPINIAPKENHVTKETYLKEFDSNKHGPLHEKPWVIDEIKKFHLSVREYEPYYCNNCFELWPTKQSKCETCDGNSIKFTALNDMNPSHHLLSDEIKPFFYQLSMIEEMLISPILPVMSIYRLSGGQLVTNGSVINFKQDISNIVTDLPRLINELPIIIVKKSGVRNNSKEFKVNKNRVLTVLNFLINNNPALKSYGIQLNIDNLNLLPDDQVPIFNNEIIVEDLDANEKEIIYQDLGPEIIQNEYDIDCDRHFFVQPEEEKALQFDKIKHKLNWPNVSTTPINEFEFDGLCSLVFPKLFPFGLGDPTKKSRREMVSETQATQHLLKYATLNPISKQYYYPFAVHPRFKFWIYDRISRHRTLDQTKIYLKQNPGDSTLTINELKKMLSDGSAEQLLRRMTPYSANITGSNAYWYQRRIELESIFEQKKPATVFFTFSYADNHWEDLHRLLPGGFSNDPKTRYLKVLNNPHLVDWYFGVRLNEFLKVVFDGILQCDWRWFRYEWQARSSIHAHGAARFKNDPGLTELTKKVYVGRLAEKELASKHSSESKKNELLTLVQEGKNAEIKVITYAETLLSAMNSRLNSETDGPPDIHPSSLNFLDIDPNNYKKDYEDLLNCVQRHICRPNGYCKSKKFGKGCRFEFPKPIQEKTEIIFKETENHVVAEIKLKRNDSNMNVHNILCCHHWRGNTDMQIIIDKNAAIRYMVKYASKPEKSSQSYLDIFRTILSHSSEEDDPRTKLRSLMLKTSCGQRDIGQSEVCRLLMSGPLCQSSFQFVSHSLDLKSRQIHLNKHHNDQEIIIKKSMLDYFAERKNLSLNLESIYNFVDFCINFQLIKNEIIERNNKEKVVVITSPRIRYNPLDIQNHTKFCLYQIIKYSSWDKSNICEISNFETAIQRFENFIKIVPDRIVYSLSFFNEFLKELKRIRDESDPEPESELLPTEYTELSELVPVAEIIDRSAPLADTSYDWKLRKQAYSNAELQSMVNWIVKQKNIYKDEDDSNCPIVHKDSLNKMQRFAFNIVEYHSKNGTQLLMIIIGTAGTGKSFTIFAISTYLNHILRRCAPTAKAAFIIRGETVHSLFGIKVDNDNEKIPSEKLSQLQLEFQHVRFIIIDEYSMLSQRMFGLIDNRLRVIKADNRFFGGVSVILVGDPGQLLPVCGAPLYYTKSNQPNNLDGYNAYNQFKIVVKLEQVERQRVSNDIRQQRFIELLPRCRNGENTIEDWELLLQNSVTPTNIHKFIDSTRLFLENDKVDTYNNQKLNDLNTPIMYIQAVNSSNSFKRLSSEQCSGLANHFYVAINAQITLTSNLWISKGLVNSANGIVKDIIVSDDYVPGDMPIAIIVEIPEYTGPQFFMDQNRKNYIPINPLTAFSKLTNGSRKQMPLRLGYAMTIHKSQGQTLSSAVIDLGKSEKSLGLTFVALSRLKNINDFLVVPFPFDRLTKIKNSINLIPRLKEEERLDQLRDTTLLNFYFLQAI